MKNGESIGTCNSMERTFLKNQIQSQTKSTKMKSLLEMLLLASIPLDDPQMEGTIGTA